MCRVKLNRKWIETEKYYTSSSEYPFDSFDLERVFLFFLSLLIEFDRDLDREIEGSIDFLMSF